MKALNFLVNYTFQNASDRKLELIQSKFNNDELILFNSILANDLTTDVEAAKIAFNLKSSNSKYKKTKNNLINKIFDAILIISPKIKGAKEEFKNIIDANKSAQIAYLLSLTGNIQKVVPILEDKIKVSQRAFSHNSTSILANLLMTHFVYINYDKQKIEYYINIFKSSVDWFYKESISTLYRNKAESYFSKNRFVNKEEFNHEVLEYIKILEPDINTIPSLTYHRNYYTLLMMVHHVNKEYQTVVETCDTLLAFIKKWPIRSFILRKTVIRHKIEHLMLLKNYNESVMILEELIAEEQEGSVGWFNSYRYLILCKINQKELQSAFEKMTMLVNSKYYKTYKTGLKYLLGFTNLYLSLIGKMGFININEIETYNVNKFLKEFPNTTKEKEAMNIPIIIAQLIEAILTDNQGEVFDRLEALKKYSSRYITKNNNSRSNCYINMLIEVVKQNYHPIAIKRHTSRYYSRLINMSHEDSNEAAEVEFIPYEYQWELLMAYLANRRNLKQQYRQ